MTLLCDLKEKKVVFATRQIKLLIKIFPLVRGEYFTQRHPQASVAQIYSQTSQKAPIYLLIFHGVAMNSV